MPSTKVQTTPTGQYVTTIPKNLAEAMGIKKGDQLTWKVAGAGKLEILL